ncbi:hypothetical protein [Methylocystis parvus]|uniref:DUF3300 domain-containing protein n=1 Tax=Methylocystis parvus TaxID=134 RepID=A0A6B8M3D9_9HYPH|nr:hypothetical protein [Methylocystis parvus]QGM96876.1 hypothetical protein F7D14_04895 [Methylocystis parvus]WBJ99242.1 hypothetical protein MMG94_14725 [Methylocystis parvus OBBP]
MKLGRSSRHALCAFAGLAAACAAPAQAADDKSTLSSVGELVGYSSDPSADKIDYSERPKLVLPPRAGDLPAPREDASRPDGWPTDIAAARRRNTDRYAKVANAPPEEAKKGLLERIRGPKPDYAPGTDDEPGFLQRALNAGARSSTPVMDEPPRRMLSEPPSGYRRPTTDLAKIRDVDPKKSTSWWNPLTYMGGNGNDSDPVAQTAGTAPAQRTAGGNGGGLFSGAMPTFLRGSDN